MKFYSTSKNSQAVSFKTAVVTGLAPDNGLYLPEQIPHLECLELEKLATTTDNEICYQMARALIEDEIPEKDLRRIVNETIDFPIPLVPITDVISALELYHGPTLAFKDVGARFMARVLGHFVQGQDKEITVLVATSGDTGSAVAHGFLGVPGIRVVLLYPSGKVSELQEKQLTTMGQNITALEVKGVFDDCQSMVKQAFLDKDLQSTLKLTSANSINIARLLPQSFYYALGVKQFLNNQEQLPVICVPSGNFGNLTAGILATRLGLPVKRFVAATNANDVVPKYLQEGVFHSQPSVQTISNAMDVGNPSNLVRIQDLFEQDVAKICQQISSLSILDNETRHAIKSVAAEYDYILDPHGAVAFLGLSKSLQKGEKGFIIETAHPAKFGDVVEPLLSAPLEVPDRLADYMAKEKRAQLLEPVYEQLKEVLLTTV